MKGKFAKIETASDSSTKTVLCVAFSERRHGWNGNWRRAVIQADLTASKFDRFRVLAEGGNGSEKQGATTIGAWTTWKNVRNSWSGLITMAAQGGLEEAATPPPFVLPGRPVIAMGNKIVRTILYTAAGSGYDSSRSCYQVGIFLDEDTDAFRLMASIDGGPATQLCYRKEFAPVAIAYESEIKKCLDAKWIVADAKGQPPKAAPEPASYPHLSLPPPTIIPAKKASYASITVAGWPQVQKFDTKSVAIFDRREFWHENGRYVRVECEESETGLKEKTYRVRKYVGNFGTEDAAQPTNTVIGMGWTLKREEALAEHANEVAALLVGNYSDDVADAMAWAKARSGGATALPNMKKRTLLRHVALYCNAGTSDKVYVFDLWRVATPIPEGKAIQWSVAYALEGRWGRRGSKLTAVPKANGWPSQMAAESVMDKAIAKEKNKGYVDKTGVGEFAALRPPETIMENTYTQPPTGVKFFCEKCNAKIDPSECAYESKTNRHRFRFSHHGATGVREMEDSSLIMAATRAGSKQYTDLRINVFDSKGNAYTAPLPAEFPEPEKIQATPKPLVMMTAATALSGFTAKPTSKKPSVFDAPAPAQVGTMIKPAEGPAVAEHHKRKIKFAKDDE